MEIWVAPICLTLLSLIGLISALIDDDYGDIASWIALTIPLVVIFYYGIFTN